MPISLADLVDDIPPPFGSADDSVRAREIPHHPRSYVGRNAAGLPVVLLSTLEPGFHPPIRLGGIDAQFSLPCRITTSTNNFLETFTVLACTATDRQIQRYFLYVADTILRIVGVCPPHSEVVATVRRLMELFQRLADPPKKSIVGLWGELYLLSRAPDHQAAIDAWHNEVDDRYDFATPSVRLEVKATSGKSRIHHFSAEQCTPPSGTVGVVASLFVESSSGGPSALDLMARIEAKVFGRPEAIIKLQRVVACMLGQSFSRAINICFDEHIAAESLQYYDLGTIPAIRSDVPQNVSHVHFRSNLMSIPPVLVSSLRASHQEVAALVPPQT